MKKTIIFFGQIDEPKGRQLKNDIIILNPNNFENIQNFIT